MKRVVLAALFVAIGFGQANGQDAAAGEKVFLVCKVCHQVGDSAKNAVGPVLNGLFGRKAGTVAGYSYSNANKNSGITWDEATFSEYINDPKAKVPGTKDGVRRAQGRAENQRFDRLSPCVRQGARSGRAVGSTAVDFC